MQKSSLKTGFSLTEIIAAISIIVIVGSISLVSIKALMGSYNSGDNARSLIKAALSNARAIASKEGTYAGVRFQREYISDGIDNASQYMIFVKYDFEGTNLSNGFRAVEGKKPIKLPGTIGVMDLMVRDGSNKEIEINSDTDINLDKQLQDALTFTVIFSPSGSLIVRDVQVRNRDAENDPDNFDAATNNNSNDPVFNSPVNILNGIGRFIQDDYPGYTNTNITQQGLDKESSRLTFVTFDREAFNKIDKNKRWSEFLSKKFEDSGNDPINRIYINSYTGQLISDDE